MIGNLVQKRPKTNTGAGLTQVHFADECNIKKMMARAKQGIPPIVSAKRPMFGDFSNVHSYQDAVIQIQSANEAFMELPATIRKELKNDPGELLRVLDDPDKSRAIALGLLPKPPSSGPAQAPGTVPDGSQGKSPETPPTPPGEGVNAQ